MSQIKLHRERVVWETIDKFRELCMILSLENVFKTTFATLWRSGWQVTLASHWQVTLDVWIQRLLPLTKGRNRVHLVQQPPESALHRVMVILSIYEVLFRALGSARTIIATFGHSFTPCSYFVPLQSENKLWLIHIYQIYCMYIYIYIFFTQNQNGLGEGQAGFGFWSSSAVHP